LKRLDEYYDELPADTKEKGVYSFAVYPPNDDSYLVTQLWKKHMKPPDGQEQRPKYEGKTWYVPPAGSDPKEIIKAINDFEVNAVPLGPETPITMDEAAVVQFSRVVRRTKGKWIRVPQKDEE